MGSGVTGSGSVLKGEQGGHAFRCGALHFCLLTSSCQQLWCGIQCHLEDPLEIPIPIQTPGMGTTVCRASLISESTVLGMPLDTWVIWKSPTDRLMLKFWTMSINQPRASPYWQLNSKKATWPGLSHQESSAVGQGSVCEPHSSVPYKQLLSALGQLEKWEGGHTVAISFDSPNNCWLTFYHLQYWIFIKNNKGKSLLSWDLHLIVEER